MLDNDIKKYMEEINTKGFVRIPEAISKELIECCIEDIQKATDIDTYYDQNGFLRRIEKLYDKGQSLINLNNDITKTLSIIFGFDFVIFKDKYNAKPPNGEGFFAHYDGVFYFINESNKQERGWYKYTDYFMNVLIALDKCDEENGTIELSCAHKGGFDKLLQNTKKNGTPDIIESVEKQLIFESVELNVGDVVIFSNTCPHRSSKNTSDKSRRTLYYTYTKQLEGSYYDQYFLDKKNSKNKSSKSLSGEK